MTMADVDLKMPSRDPDAGAASAGPSPPFTPNHQLNWALDNPQNRALPGYPNLPLNERDRLWEFLEKELWADDLHRIAERLWWMTKQDSANISPLHKQTVKRRSIVVTEDPKLHLLWIRDRVFIKPLPPYLLSYVFWRDILCHGSGPDDPQRERIRKAALGYLRTYRYLIQYESDFCIAQDSATRLIPELITWEQFCALSSDLEAITDDHVSARYHFGEIRLTRLNFYAPITLKRWTYQRVEYQSSEFFARFYGPILFMVGMLSVILSGFQVSLEVDQSHALMAAAFGFSVFSILWILILPLIMSFIFLFKMAVEWRFAVHERRRIIRERHSKAVTP